MRPRAGVRLAALLVLAAAVLLLSRLPLVEWLDALSAWVLARPIEGAAVYVIAAAIGGVLMTPGWIPMMLAGLLFGPVKGIAIGALGIVAGATAAFLVGRGLLRGPVERRIAGNATLRAIDRAVDKQGFMIVMLTRLALLLPYNLLNYAYGATGVSLRTYTFATAIGMLPAIALYVYLGTLAGDVGQMLDDGGEPPAGTWWISGVALAAVLAVTIIIQRAARRALADEMSDAAASRSEE